jgi:hypothetical protein
MNKHSFKLGLISITCILLSACGGGGSDGSNNNTNPFNYAALNGQYDCKKAGQSTGVGVKVNLSEQQLIAELSLLMGSNEIPYGTVTVKDKVGFINGQPYYSSYIPLTTNAETYFFYNNKLHIVTTPVASIPDALANNPSQISYCTKRI